MVAELTRKRVFVLSDSEGLSRAIALNLSPYMEVTRFVLNLSERRLSRETTAGDFDLIIVAMSLPTSEPVVALAKASLTRWIGQVPILIISDKPFQPDQDNRIVHLDFPFKAEGFYNKVKTILQEGLPAVSTVRQGHSP